MTKNMKNTLLTKVMYFLETNLHRSTFSKITIKKYLPCRCPYWFQDTYYFHCSTSSRPLIGKMFTEERDSALIGNVLNKWYVMWCCAVLCCAAFRFVVLHGGDDRHKYWNRFFLCYTRIGFSGTYIFVSRRCVVLGCDVLFSFVW